MHKEDGNSLQSGEGKEEPLDNRTVDPVSHHQKAKDPRDAQDGQEDQGGMEEGARVSGWVRGWEGGKERDRMGGRKGE